MQHNTGTTAATDEVELAIADAAAFQQGGGWVRLRLDGGVTAGALITAIAHLIGRKVEGVALGEQK